MTLHVPIDILAKNTDITDQEPFYINVNTYADGTEVRTLDGIYSVKNISKDIQYPDFQDYKYYTYGDAVNINGVGYKKVSGFFDRGCWSTLDSANGTPVSQLDALNFEFWDGINFSTGYDAGANNAPCENNVIFYFDDYGKVNNYRNVRVRKVDSNTLENTTIGMIKLYDEIVPNPNGCYVIIDGKVSKVFGKSTDYITTTGIQTGEWVKLEKNYYTENKHSLTYIRPLTIDIPFDTKQYTVVKKQAYQWWNVTTEVGKTDAIALGGVLCGEITLEFIDQAGYKIGEIFKTINATKIPKTLIYYVPSNIKGTVKSINIILAVGKTQIGLIMPTTYKDIGLTALKMKLVGKNFDRVKVSDISGYEEEIKGNRILEYSGSFDMKSINFDEAVEFQKDILQERIAIDGSDTHSNEDADGKTIFSSTKLIGKMRSMEMETSTNRNKNEIDKYITVPFRFEEVV